jgi:hypothetical protein
MRHGRRATGTGSVSHSTAVHDEIARLPAKLRLPIVLCYLEGLTQPQAATRLRCGEATLRRRLAGARERLRVRLARRGFAPTASALGVSLAQQADAAIPAVSAQTTKGRPYHDRPVP